MIKVDEVTAPAHWLPYLINGDASDMDAADLEACHEWQGKIRPFYVVSDVEDSERFTWSYRLHGGTAEGGTVCDYIVHSEA